MFVLMRGLFWNMIRVIYIYISYIFNGGQKWHMLCHKPQEPFIWGLL